MCFSPPSLSRSNFYSNGKSQVYFTFRPVGRRFLWRLKSFARSRFRSRHSLTARFQIRAEFRRAFHVVRTHGRSGGVTKPSPANPVLLAKPPWRIATNSPPSWRYASSRTVETAAAVNKAKAVCDQPFFRLGGDDSLDLDLLVVCVCYI